MSSFVNQVYKVATSPLPQAIVLTGSTAVLAGKFIVDCAEAMYDTKPLFPVVMSKFPVLFLVGCVTITYAFWNRKQIQNECGSTKNIFRHWQNPGSFPWWNYLIDKKLALGALPMASKNHLEEFQKMGITHVLSLVEDFELEGRTFYLPVQSAEYQEKSIEQLQLSTEDCVSPDVEIIDKAVSWIHSQVESGGQVYVHCKSGKGRSAVVSIAYMIQYGFKHDATLQQIILENRGKGDLQVVKAVRQYVKGIRPQISMSDRGAAKIVEYLQKKQ